MKYPYLIGITLLMSCGNSEVGRYVPAGDGASFLVDTKTGDICIPKSGYDKKNKANHQFSKISKDVETNSIWILKARPFILPPLSPFFCAFLPLVA
jgi:hypothetical protein